MITPVYTNYSGTQTVDRRKVLAMRTLIYCGCFLLMCSIISAQQNDIPYGFTNQQLEAALSHSGLVSQRLYSIQTFGDSDTAHPAYMAGLSSSKSGWHVWVFHRVRGGFELEWSSGKLPIEFSVSSPGEFSIFDIGDESTVMFSGCAQHLCGGGYHGFLLYSTARKDIFFALLDNRGNQPRRISFSKNALEQRNRAYKDALQKAVDEVIRRTDVSK